MYVEKAAQGGSGEPLKALGLSDTIFGGCFPRRPRPANAKRSRRWPHGARRGHRDARLIDSATTAVRAKREPLQFGVVDDSHVLP